MRGDAAAGQRRSDRLAFAGMAVVLLVLTLFAVAAAWSTHRTANVAIGAARLSQAYQDAQSALAAEESLERKYRLEPSVSVRNAFAVNSAAVTTAIREVEQAGDAADRRLVRSVRARHDSYIAATGRLFDAVDVRDQQRVLAIDHDETEPAFTAISARVNAAADAHARAAVQSLIDLRRTQTLVVWATPLVFGLGLILLWFFAQLLRGYQRELSYQAGHDALTGLPNRAMFDAQLAAALARARESSQDVAILLLDLDRFKEINDTLGHLTGDRLLTEIGPRLRSAVRGDDLIARLGGDEFAILLAQAGAEPADAVAARVVSALQEPVIVDGLALTAEASVGIARYPRDGDTAGELLQRADVAMYAAKSSNSDVTAYDPTLNGHDSRKLSLLPELRRALAGGELVVHYQPLVNLGDRQLHAVEALVRWERPGKGLVAPSEFIPLAETSGLIHDLTRHVLAVAVEQAGQWLVAGQRVPMSVNISTRCLLDLSLPNTVREILRAAELPPELLILEITESAIMADPVRAREVLVLLEALGVRIALDDFGTGYTSMSYLRDLPVHELKIDRTFVARMSREAKDAIIVHTAIDLAHRLGLRTVAEGVEDESTWTALAHLDCDIAQGFHMGRPMSAEAFSDWLVDWQRERVAS